MNSTGGWNPVTGRDPGGGHPTFAPAGGAIPVQGQPYIPHFGGPGYNFDAAPQYVTYGSVNPFQAYPPAVYTPAPTAGFQTTHTFSHQPNGTGNVFPRQPTAGPAIDPDMPAMQMSNTTGGVGCEPGYNYFFPAEHTKVHVLKSRSPPWQLPASAQVPFTATHVPCDTKLEALLKGFGCTNPVPKRNRCYEVVSGGNGKWYKGFSFGGDDKDHLKMTLADVGWDSSRAGLPGGKPVVCLWFCKN
ncbi:hypothetical protein AK830_g6271 [Neonectria ditissima]|uniref:Uncharacterized protein n=1 Tax=Neonectria ditissima TaxID=78410 RepID=A0A0P7BIX4_9HYPO|nr:hypothetical protein AK830_g6271 [Neonectria ditissima]